MMYTSNYTSHPPLVLALSRHHHIVLLSRLCLTSLDGPDLHHFTSIVYLYKSLMKRALILLVQEVVVGSEDKCQPPNKSSNQELK